MLPPSTSTTPGPATESHPDFLTEMGVGHPSVRRTPVLGPTDNSRRAHSSRTLVPTRKHQWITCERGAAMQITRRLTSPRPLVTDPEVPGTALVLCVDALTTWLSETLEEPCTVAMHRVRHDHGAGVALAFDLTTVREGRRLTRPCVARAYAHRSNAEFKALLA